MTNDLVTNDLICCMQYVPRYFSHIHERITYLFERYSLLLCIGIVWAFAAILTAAGAYNHVSPKTQQHCRTDKSFLMSSAPWYGLEKIILYQNFKSCIFWRRILIYFRHAYSCRIKIPYPFQWGTPIFTAGHSFGMMGAVLVGAFEVKLKPDAFLISLYSFVVSSFSVFLFKDVMYFVVNWSTLCNCTSGGCYTTSRSCP